MALDPGQQWALYLLMGLHPFDVDPGSGKPRYAASQFRKDVEDGVLIGKKNPDAAFRDAVAKLDSSIKPGDILYVSGLDPDSIRTALAIPYSGPGPCPSATDARSIYMCLKACKSVTLTSGTEAQ